MTPQTDAARVGITGFLDALDPRVDTILTLQRAGRSIPLKASHLRLVLAALDETQRPCSHTWNGHIDTSETGATIHLGGYSGDGKLLAAHARARDLAADLGNALDEQQAQADARAEGWG